MKNNLKTKQNKSKKLQNFIWNLVEKKRKTKNSWAIDDKLTTTTAMKFHPSWFFCFFFFFCCCFVCLFFYICSIARANSKDSTNRHTTDPGRFESRHQAKEEEDFNLNLLLQQLRGIFRIMSRFSFHRFIFCGMHLVRYWIKKLSKFCWVGVLEKWNYLNKESTVLLRCGHA